MNRRATRRRRAAPRQVRRVTQAEWPRVMRFHQAAGTCPSCRREVPTFCSLFEPGDDLIGFGCEYCHPKAALSIKTERAIREALSDWQ